MRLGVNGRFYAARVTGVQRFALEVAGRLLADATLFLPAGAQPPRGLPGSTRVVHGRLSGHAWEQFELPGQVRRSGCDTVLHMAGTAPLAAAGDVLVVHDVLPLTHPRWFTRGFRLWRSAVLHRAAPRAARVVTVSEWARREIARTLPVAPERIVVAPQGVEPFDRPASPEEVAGVRARRNLPGPFLLTVGAGDPRKNLPFLGRVLRRWRERGAEPPPLAVVGDPSPRLFTPAEGWPADVDVRLLGRVDDAELRALYTAATVLCFPSRAEGFGRPPLEALACGTPAVVADYGAAAEVLGDAARIVPTDPDAWVDALVPLVEDGRRTTAGAALTARYRWDAAAETIRAACEAAGAERRSGGR
ncbi:MAG TPA: glycosyltransferase family 1 protein [Longimicrobiaceae bacterium]|nr:glycosyltransferase family 1 protein [Longimicrobiaceae bacterium]